MSELTKNMETGSPPSKIQKLEKVRPDSTDLNENLPVETKTDAAEKPISRSVPNINDIGTAYSKSGIRFILVDEFEDVKTLVRKLETCERFAFDCESVKLNRFNKVSVINICLEDGTIFLIDVQKIGEIPLGLKLVLESESIIKVMFDCRSDSDSLLHQHKIRLSGIEDMQIMRYMFEYPGKTPERKLSSFRWSVGHYLSCNQQSRLVEAMISNYSAWGRRPLANSLLEYASYEISLFFPLREKMKQNCPATLHEIQQISGRHADKRRNGRYTEGRQNGYMSPGVI
eukprot:gene811-106_t